MQKNAGLGNIGRMVPAYGVSKAKTRAEYGVPCTNMQAGLASFREVTNLETDQMAEK